MYFTDAIVLSKTDVGEADAVFSLYTKEYGKIHARAQGIKKGKAKLRGHLETLALSHVGFVTTKNGERLIYAEASAMWPGIRADFERMRAAMYFASLVDSATFAGESDPDVWSHLKSAFGALERGGGGGGGRGRYFDSWPFDSASGIIDVRSLFELVISFASRTCWIAP